MATAKEREEFIAQLTRALPDKSPHHIVNVARLLMRHAKTHGNLAEQSCNGHPCQSSPTMDARVIGKLLEQRMTALCAELGITPNFGGDPRGYTVKVHLPNGASNTWGGKEEGYGVPQ